MQQLTTTAIMHSLIDEAIESIIYHVFDGTSQAACLVTLKDGSSAIGTGEPASGHTGDAECSKAQALFGAKEKLLIKIISNKTNDLQRPFGNLRGVCGSARG